MGIFNLFKKENEENTNTNENREELTSEHAKNLLNHITADKDHGETMMKLSSLSENIFVIGYIENAIMPQVVKEKNKNDYMFFQAVLLSFRKIVYDKIMKTNEFWKVICKTTGYPFLENGFAHILINGNNIETMKETLKKYHYDVDIVKINNEELKSEFKELYRLGYKGVLLGDGKLKPCTFPLEIFTKDNVLEFKDSIINPKTQYSMISFFQEIRRNINYEGSDEIRNKLERMMIYYIVNTNFIVPIKKGENDKIESPIYIINKDDNSNYTGLYVFTDEVEAKALEEKGINKDRGWEIQSFNFNQVVAMAESHNMNEICVNFNSICFRINEELLKVFKEQAKVIYDNNEKAKENWETNKLPKILKNKEIPSIKDSNNKILFKREKNKMSISTYILSILNSRNLSDDIMDYFIDDEDIKEISFYDINDRNITLKLDENNENKGLYIMPMRYDDDSENISDASLHHSKSAYYIEANKLNVKDIKCDDKHMHFYTILNKESSKLYLPVFKDIKDIEQVFPRNNYRYCVTSYEDIINETLPFEGVVIDPLNMSIIIKNKYLSKIKDIELNL